jgi:murein L,D-transpeptidase YafK
VRTANRLHHSFRRNCRLALLLVLLCAQGAFSALVSAAAAESEEIWLLVDTSSLTLKVMQGESPLREYDNIAIGSNGPTLAKLVLDETTPLGEFRINRFNPRSKFHLFMAFDYPTMEHARRALHDGRLSPEDYVKVNNAWLSNEPPPQDTPLGGYLGIHGLGDGDEEVHGRFNWTNGCIAVTNEQIEELAHWVVLGTRVSVR